MTDTTTTTTANNTTANNDVKKEEDIATAAAPTNIINLTEDGGVTKRIIKEGDGPTPPPGAGVTTHYEARLKGSTTPFDSSRGRELPFCFKLGGGRVIRGWDIAVATMHRNEIAEVTISPEYAYGDSDEVPNVPANSTLVYEIELTGWDERVDASRRRDMSISKDVENYGNSFDIPVDGGKVTIDYTVYKGVCETESVVSKKEDYTFVLGDYETDNLALEEAVLSMKLHEKSRFHFEEFCTEAPEEWKNKDISVEITLKTLENPPSAFTLGSPEEVLAEAERIKTQGNELYAAKDMRMAVRRYKRGIDLLCSVRRPTPEQRKLIVDMKVLFYLNTAAAQLYAKKNRDAVDACMEALKLSPKNEKALLRRGKAFKAMERWDDAIADFSAVLEIAPENEDAKKSLALSKRGLAKCVKKQDDMYRGIFN